MTVTFGPFDTGAGSGMLTSQWSKMFTQVFGSGACSGWLNELAVVGDSTGMQVKVSSGAALIRGHFYETTAVIAVAIAAAHATLARWDILALEVDWTKNDNQISLVDVQGTPNASPALPTLTQTASKWQIPLAKVVIAAAATTITAANVTDMRTMLAPSGGGSGGVFASTNKSGITLSKGFVVVNNSAYDQAVKTTTLIADPSTVGVATGSIAIDAQGNFAASGLNSVAVTGTVTRGHWLVSSATPGYAQDSGFVTKPTSGGIGIAQTGNVSGLGSVICLVNIDPTSSQAGLQKLASESQATGSGLTLSWTHTVDVGTDCLVVHFQCMANSIVSATWGAQSLDISKSYVYDTNRTVGILHLKNPVAGTGTITITFGNSSTGSSGKAVNYIGTQAVPFRTMTPGTAWPSNAISVTATSATGDIVIGTIGSSSDTIAPGAGQTALVTNLGPSNVKLSSSTKPGDPGTTTMSYTQPAGTYSALLVVALKGS